MHLTGGGEDKQGVSEGLDQMAHGRAAEVGGGPRRRPWGPIGPWGGVLMGSRPPDIICQACWWQVIHLAKKATDRGRMVRRDITETWGLWAECGQVGYSTVSSTRCRSVKSCEVSTIALRMRGTWSHVVRRP